MEHLQSCPLLVLFTQIHDLASVENFGQNFLRWKHFPKSLNHFSSLFRLQSPFLAVSRNWCPLTWAAWISHSEIKEAYVLLPIFDGNTILLLCTYVEVPPCSAPQPLPLQHLCYYSFEPSSSIFLVINFWPHYFCLLLQYLFLLIHDNSIFLLTLGWPNHPWLPGLVPDLRFKRYEKHKLMWDICTSLNLSRAVWINC